MTTQPHQKQHKLISRRVFLLKSRTLSISHGRNQITSTSRIFLKYKCQLYLKHPLTPSQRKIIVAYRTSNHKLFIKNGRWTSSPISRGTRLCHFCSYNAIENEVHFVLEFPYIIPLEISFHHYLRTQFQGASSLSFNQTNKLTLASISHRLPHSTTLEN